VENKIRSRRLRMEAYSRRRLPLPPKPDDALCHARRWHPVPRPHRMPTNPRRHGSLLPLQPWRDEDLHCRHLCHHVQCVFIFFFQSSNNPNSHLGLDLCFLLQADGWRQLGLEHCPHCRTPPRPALDRLELPQHGCVVVPLDAGAPLWHHRCACRHLESGYDGFF